MIRIAFALSLVAGLALAQQAPVVPPKPSVAPPVQEPPKPVPVPAQPQEKLGESAIAKKTNLRIEFTLDGMFEPSERHAIQVKLEAYQGELLVSKIASHGQAVKQGDVILVVDPGKFREALEAAELGLAS